MSQDTDASRAAVHHQTFLAVLFGLMALVGAGLACCVATFPSSSPPTVPCLPDAGVRITDTECASVMVVHDSGVLEFVCLTAADVMPIVNARGGRDASAR